MKIGVCTGVENIKKMEDIGFDYIEPSVVSIAKMNDEEFNAAMNLVDGSNISGGARKIPDGWSREEAWKQLVRIARIAGDVAAEYGLTIAMEPLNTSETNILNSVEEGLRFVTDVGHTHVKLLADFYHMRRENENMDVLVKAGSTIAHLHIANSNGRVCPLDRSEDVYDAFFQKLKEVGYQGRISIEAGIKDVDRDAPVGLNLLRELSK